MQPAQRRSHQSAGRTDRGAVAVEFALLMPLLAMFLFGIIQYGYGLFQYQAFASAMDDAAQVAGKGFDTCAFLGNTVTSRVQANGLDPADVSNVKIKWLSTDGAGALVPATGPTRLGTAELTASFAPLHFGIPLVPFPSQFTRTQQVLMANVNTAQYSLTGCIG